MLRWHASSGAESPRLCRVGALPTPTAWVPVRLDSDARRACERVGYQRPSLQEGASDGFLFSFGQAPMARVRPEGRTSRGACGRVRDRGSAAAVHTLEVWAAQPSTGGRERNP